LSKDVLRQKIRQYLIVGIGCTISAIGINAFYAANQLFSGGISGIAMFSYFLYGWPIGLVAFILNIPLFLAAYKLLSLEYTVGAVYGMAIFSIVIDSTSFLAQYKVIDDTFLAAIYGGIVAGIGAGTVFRVNGSMGGLDIVAAIMKKYYNYNMGMVGFSINIFIMFVAAILFGVKMAMYTLIAMFIAANVTDKVIEGFNRRKTVFIISPHYEKIALEILHEVHRGVTMLDAYGAYTREEKRVIMVVVNNTQVPQIRLLVDNIDPSAFMIVNATAEVTGKGF
jgi:uncharacterized membrane-anchored protein YitT (DUF2179 family)